MASNAQKFTNIVSEGGMLPVDILGRIYAQDSSLPGLSARSYHLDAGDRLSDAIARSWGPLRARWETFKLERSKFASDERGTSATRERWLLPLFAELGFGRLAPNKAEEIQGRSYPVSHLAHHSPIHLVGSSISLDEKKAGVAGAARNSPHSLVQEYLNRSSDKLWGFVSNGLLLRIVRDNVSLTRQSYVEFDLEGIFESQSYADFAILWLLCHHSRIESEAPETCWLEQWAELARTDGTRALDHLRAGVEKAIVALGGGFLAEKSNTALRERLRTGALGKDDYYRELLRLIYRLIFIFAAEDRGLLLIPTANEKSKQRFQKFYSSARLRELSTQIRGTHHTDLFRSLKIVFSALGSEKGAPDLGLPALGSFLWSPSAAQHLDTCELPNSALLEAFRALTTVADGKVRRHVDYKNLGSEELGSIYESLLELHPQINADAGHFELSTAAGNERKTSGSYYTPSSLINCLLDSALEPVVEEALKKERSEKAILQLKVCDPACGSGHFLIAAAHRLAKHLASIRTGETEPPPQATRHALRDIVGHCIYGVDINPMAVELCKVGLWLEALEPGKPLSFLEHRIQCGNSLLGATPALLDKGIPDEAFEPIEGDDKKVCSLLKKRNKKERESKNQVTMFGGFEAWDRLGNISAFINTLDDIDDSSIEGIQRKQKLYEEQVQGSNYLFSRFWADAWCAAFVWRKTPDVSETVTEEVFRRIEQNPHTVSPFIQGEVKKIARDYKFFHWHLAFPDVFRIPKRGEKATNDGMGWSGGFDVLLGNPPWEKIHLKDDEFFAASHPNIAAASNKSIRKELIASLAVEDPSAFSAYVHAQREHSALSNFFRFSSRYPLTGLSRINLYSIFGELSVSLISDRGRTGFVLASGIATDENNGAMFSSLIANSKLHSVYDFENRNSIFVDVDSRFKFSLVSLRGGSVLGPPPDLAFFLHSVDELSNTERHFSLTFEELKLLNPESLTCPTFRSRREAALAFKLYKTGQTFGSIPASDEWPGKPRTPFNMSNDSGIFKSGLSPRPKITDSRIVWVDPNEGEILPLYESKLIHQFNHRFATFAPGAGPEDECEAVEAARLHSTECLTLGRYWLTPESTTKRFPGSWWLVYRMITKATDERTAMSTVIPGYPCGNSLSVISNISAANALILCANINSLAFDYCARAKVGGMNFNHFIFNQLPVIPLERYSLLDQLGVATNGLDWIASRAFELIYTATDLSAFAAALGRKSSPFSWDSNRRATLRAELDAAFLLLYGLSREDAEFIFDQFPGLRRNEENEYQEYRTRRLVLEAYDRLVIGAGKKSGK